MHPLNAFVRQSAKQSRVELLIRIDDVNQKMSYPLPVGERRFSSTDIKIAIDLLRIRVDDSATDGFGESHRQFALAHRCWTKDDDNFGQHSSQDIAKASRVQKF